MKKKTSQKLNLSKIKVSSLSMANVAGERNRTLPVTQHKTCPPTHWVC